MNDGGTAFVGLVMGLLLGLYIVYLNLRIEGLKNGRKTDE